MIDLLAQLKGVARGGNGWTARCPAHDDRYNSLSIHHRDGRWLLKCHAGCDWQHILKSLKLEPSALFDNATGGGGAPARPRNNRATAQPKINSAGPGLSLEQYAAAKALSVEFVKT